MEDVDKWWHRDATGIDRLNEDIRSLYEKIERPKINKFFAILYGGCSSDRYRVLECDSRGRGFNSPQPPQNSIAVSA